MNLSIHHFKLLIFPSFWWNALYLAIKEHWIYLVVLSLIFNGSSLLQGEIMEFIISGAFASIIIGILFILYVVFNFTVKAFKDEDFRLMLNSKPSIFVAREILGVKLEELQIKESSSLSDDLPDISSKIGFTFIIVVGLSTICGLVFTGYLIANR